MPSSNRSILLASTVFPPAGLVLLWLRSDTGLMRKLLGSFLITAWGVAYLVLFFGLRYRLNGGGTPIPVFDRKESQYAELERSRNQQQPPAAVEAAAPAPVAAPDAAVKPKEPAGENYWTGFRGKERNGRYDPLSVLIPWPKSGPPQVWRQPIGGGYASFVVAGGRAFTIEQRRHQEAATAYDLATGRELWADKWDAEFRESMGGDGPRATPAWDEGKVYVLGATGEFRCLDAATGRRIWSRNILTDNGATNLQWGMSAAPLIVDDKVVVLPGGSGGKSVVAYNKLTGEPVWKALDDMQAYTSPMLVTLAGKRQILVVSAKRIMGLAPESGALLWSHPWVTEYDINSAQPIVLSPNRVFVSAGYGHGSVVLEIAPAGDKLQAKEVWSNNRMKNRFSSSVLFEGHIYGFDEAIFGCINAETGELKWKGGRYGYGQVVLAGGHLIVTTEQGEVVLIKPSPDKLQEVSRFQAVEGQTWNNPAISDGLLLVRNATEMACFRLVIQ